MQQHLETIKHLVQSMGSACGSSRSEDTRHQRNMINLPSITQPSLSQARSFNIYNNQRCQRPVLLRVHAVMMVVAPQLRRPSVLYRLTTQCHY